MKAPRTLKSKSSSIALLLLASAFAAAFVAAPSIQPVSAGSPDTITKICQSNSLSSSGPASGTLTLTCSGMIGGDVLLVLEICAGGNGTGGAPSDGGISTLSDTLSTHFASGGSEQESGLIQSYIAHIQSQDVGWGTFTWFVGGIGASAGSDTITVVSGGVIYNTGGGGIGNGCGVFAEYFSVGFLAIIGTNKEAFGINTDDSLSMSDLVSTDYQVLDFGPLMTGINTNAFVGCTINSITPDSQRSPGGGDNYFYNTAGFYSTLHDSAYLTTVQSSGDYCAVFSFWPQIATALPTALFTCSITDLTSGSYVVANINRVYDFFCEIQSDAVNATVNARITDVQMKFNDSQNEYIFEYNNATGSASVDAGGSFSSLGQPLVSQGYNATTTIRSMNITFPIILNAGAVDSVNRSLSLYAATSTGTRGFSYVQTHYFNIYDDGGTMNFLLSGDCSIPAGADTFQTICQYGDSSHNWIAENATYYDLQNYAAQFQMEMRNASTGLDESAIWQNYANSGSGTNPSSNKGDWEIRAGFYYWDNSSSTCCWVKGINVLLEMDQGRVGSNNQWTQFYAVWYDGNSMIANQTFVAFVPTDNGPSPVNIWLNFWYSGNNGSTMEGGQVSAYYTGMHKTNYLVWSSWSPFQGNASQSQVFVPLIDHASDLMSGSQTTMTKVFMNMTRPGAPSQHANQGDFSIETDGFVQQTFNIATAGTSIGIATPTFAVAVVPILQSNSIFSPIINALKSLASLITIALSGVGTAIWNGLGSRFPWFTATLSFMSGFIVNLISFIGTIFVYIIDALKFTYGIIGVIFYPIKAVIGAWDYILSTYGGIFKGANLTAMVEIVVIYVFVGWVLDNAERGNGSAFLNAATMGWRVADSMAWWVWAISKFFIDAIEGLIP